MIPNGMGLLAYPSSFSFLLKPQYNTGMDITVNDIVFDRIFDGEKTVAHVLSNTKNGWHVSVCSKQFPYIEELRIIGSVNAIVTYLNQNNFSYNPR